MPDQESAPTRPSQTESFPPKSQRAGDRAGRRSRKRVWAYRLIAAVALPLLFFAVLEAALRIVGAGYPTSFVLRETRDGERNLVWNEKFGWRFFPPSIARAPEPFRLPAEKSRFRIVVLGGSAAQGDPAPSFGFGRILEVFLERLYPDRDFEVVNGAMVAINSHVVADIARDAMELEPDLLVVYLGNNEVVGPYGPGSVFAPISSRFFIQLNKRIKTWKIVQMLEAAARSAASTGDEPARWEGMKQFLDNQLRASDPRLGAVYQNLERNLAEIAETAGRRDVPVVFCTVGVNLRDNPPFASLHRDDLSPADLGTWEALYERGIRASLPGRFDEALESFSSALEIDGQYADLHYRMATCYWGLEDYDNAAKHYGMARDYDALRFRADSRINNIIRDTAQDFNHVALVDIEQAFAEDDEHGVPGRELFHDHVHMTLGGNHLIAGEVAASMLEWLPGAAESPGSEGWPTVGETGSDVAATLIDYYHVLTELLERIKEPPFTYQLGHDDHVSRVALEISALEEGFAAGRRQEAIETYEYALEKRPDDWIIRRNFGKVLIEVGRPAEAAEQLAAVVEQMPGVAQPRSLLGIALAESGDYEESEATFRDLISMKPGEAGNYFNLATVLLQQGDEEAAMETYQKGREIDPKASEATVQMARLLDTQGKKTKAVAVLQQALEADPESSSIHYQLARLYDSQGDSEEAIRHFREALSLSERSWPDAELRLARLLATDPRDDLRNGTEAVRLALRANASTTYNNPFYLTVLADAYAETGEFDKAVKYGEEVKILFEEAGLEERAEELRRRIELYRQEKPYREVDPGSS